MSGTGPVVAYFAHDGRETAVRKRLAAFRRAGARPVSFAFRRAQAERDDAPGALVPLGRTADRAYLRRLPALGLGLLRALRRGRTLRAARLIQARNPDMLALAAAARRLSRARAPLVYEALDVQPAMLGRGGAGRLMRLAERLLLREADLLVVSSPDFVSAYFKPVQGYDGPWRLLENKLPADAAPPRPLDGPAPGPPWIVGWFGVLRCAESLDALAALADALGGRVAIRLRGRLSLSDISEARLAATLDGRPSMRFDGPYRSPEDLPALYGGVHFAWAADRTDSGANSDWLLPNRLYEAGAHGTPVLALEGTATGREAEARGLGRALAAPMAASAAEFLRDLDADGYAALRGRVAAAPRDALIESGETAALLRDVARRGPA